jgi:rRNA maturation protein Nop10
MRRFLIAFLAGGLAYGAIPSGAVFWIVFLGSWIALHTISPGTCPHCGKGVRFMADTCHHCGRAVKAEA